MANALPDSLMGSLAQIPVKPIVSLSIGGVSASSGQFQNSFMDLVYKESFKQSVQADTLDITLADPEGLFRQTFTLDSYAQVNCSITLGGSTKVLPMMFIKGIRIDSDKHSGTKVKLSCTSSPAQSAFRLEKKSQAFPDPSGTQTSTTLKDVAQKICDQDGKQLQYLPSRNPTIQRADQHDHSDSYMLHKLCSDNDFQFIEKNNTIWIRDMKDVESQSAIGTIQCPTKNQPGGWQNQGLLKWEFLETVEDIYGACDVKYTDPGTGKTAIGAATDPNQPADAPHLQHHRWFNPDTNQFYDHITLY
jgi:hypothetical protein